MSKIHIAPLVSREEFTDASAEELRVLLAARETGSLDAERLAALCKISRSRASAAIAFWKSSGIVTEDGEPTITEEFERRISSGELEEKSSVQAARDIRDHSLYEMLEECAAIMKKAHGLNSAEVVKLTALHSQYSLSAEYIVTLAAYEAGRLAKSDKKLTVAKLVDKALRLCDKEIDSVEALEEYIKEYENETAIERELRHLLGIYQRTLTKTEKKLFKKWSHEYGYFTEIIGEAYDITVAATGERRLEYMDTVLTRWNKAGCRTIAECREESEKFRRESAAKRAEKKKEDGAPDTPKYGSFDVEDAFQKALMRSYGKKD